ncbi:hypothetical protein Rhal01_02099 [Rubritalea halochordaticola]|uniref:DUF3365 domain-containing protein n=1 Tax=Rubritalea halochordaticola TaxID=714537 RepID=A0ABP9UZQ2_9BACT
MKNLLSIFILLSILSTTSYSEEKYTEVTRDKVPQGKVVEHTNWPGKYTKIIAVTYDYSVGKREENSFSTVAKDGKLHKGIYRTSKPLTEEQTKKLFSCITGKHKPLLAAACFEPHHGFIFYDKANKIVAHISICFMCHNHSFSPEGELSDHWDRQELKKLLKDLKMPIHKKPGDYTKEYLKEKGKP